MRSANPPDSPGRGVCLSCGHREADHYLNDGCYGDGITPEYAIICSCTEPFERLILMHTCPRRRESGMDNPNSPFAGAGTNRDKWSRRHRMAGAPALRQCTYCGSLDPAKLMEGLRDQSYFLGPTDKAYKIYVHVEDGSRIQTFPGEPEFPNGKLIAKFYTGHLDEDQAWEFHKMWKAGWLRFGYPGNFYRPIYLPGVIERLEAEAEGA